METILEDLKTILRTLVSGRHTADLLTLVEDLGKSEEEKTKPEPVPETPAETIARLTAELAAKNEPATAEPEYDVPTASSTSPYSSLS